MVEKAPFIRRAAAVALALLCAAAPAAADSEPRWELGLGVGALRLPHYRGSDQSNGWLLPLPYFVYRGEIIKADREGARALLVKSASVDLDVSVAAAAPTRSRDNRARAGMPDLDPMFELGPSVRFGLLRRGETTLELRVPLRAAFTIESRPRYVGLTLSPQLALDHRIGGWDVGGYVGPVFAERRFNGHFYDVAPAFANATRPAYDAPGGYAGWQAAAGLSRRIGALWLGAFVKVDDVGGARFAGSPLVRRHGAVSFGAGLSWVFASSSERVER